MSEIHCTDENPFREETLEARARSPALGNTFMQSCTDFFHMCVVAPPTAVSYRELARHCEPINFTRELAGEVTRLAGEVSDLT
jgi:hypothetical protein